jgi:hypothetical protein
MRAVQALVVGGAGFLLAVLWFDLMFDIQVLRHRPDEIGEDVLASIGGYYRRVTTEARPMNRLVALAMVTTVAAVVVGLIRTDGSRWPWLLSLVLVTAAVVVAAVRTVPHAVRLGSGADPLSRQRWLARSICRDHLFCFGAIASVFAVQLAFGS